MTSRHIAPGVLVLLLLAAGCGNGGEQPFPYANCGNGTVDKGENCDDGPANCDTCACTTICQQAFCGDGFVYIGVEQCDTNNLNRQTCTGLGFDGGALSCRACAFVTSQCGPAFTPTPVLSPTPTATPTPSPRPTATPGGECIPDGRLPVTVNFTSATGSTATIAIALAYPADAVGLPASGIESRISGRPQGTQLRDVSATANTLRATVSRPIGSFPQGRLFVVDFDRCADGPLPQPGDFTCTVEQCASPDCTCRATLP